MQVGRGAARALGCLALMVLTAASASEGAATTPNSVCQECHAVEDLRFTDRDTGESKLYTIEPRAYAESAHAGVDCVACHDSGYGDHVPHEGPAMLPRFLCVDCHEALGDLEHLDLPDRRDELKRGAHGDEGSRRMDCHDCHDPHRFAMIRSEERTYDRIAAGNEICLSCHGPADDRPFGQDGLNDSAETHGHFPNALRHFARVKCVGCHTPRGHREDHDVLAAEDSLEDCAQCHRREDPAYAASYATPGSDVDRGWFDHVYVIGSTRSALLDRTSQFGFVFFLLLVLLHSVRRRLSTGRWKRTRWLHVEGPRSIRVWHTVQILLIAGLLGSGLSMHYGDSGLAPLSFRTAVTTHNILGVANIALWLTFLVVNIRSGNARAYVTRLRALPRELPRQILYYAKGTFRGEAEPGPVHAGDRFNPLQKLAYLAVMYVISPVAVVSGSLLLYPLLAPEHALGHPGLWPMAMIHLAAGYAVTLFVVVHIYMVGSGRESGD